MNAERKVGGALVFILCLWLVALCVAQAIETGGLVAWIFFSGLATIFLLVGVAAGVAIAFHDGDW